MHELLLELEKEREILIRAIAKQSSNGNSGQVSDAILAQSQRLDGLILEVQRARTEAEEGFH